MCSAHCAASVSICYSAFPPDSIKKNIATMTLRPRYWTGMPADTRTQDAEYTMLCTLDALQACSTQPVSFTRNESIDILNAMRADVRCR